MSTEYAKRVTPMGIPNTRLDDLPDLIDVQKRFDDVNKKLNTTINRFRRNSKNKPSLFSQVEALKEFGISTSKEIPEKLLLEAEDECLEGVFAND